MSRPVTAQALLIALSGLMAVKAKADAVLKPSRQSLCKIMFGSGAEVVWEEPRREVPTSSFVGSFGSPGSPGYRSPDKSQTPSPGRKKKSKRKSPSSRSTPSPTSKPSYKYEAGGEAAANPNAPKSILKGRGEGGSRPKAAGFSVRHITARNAAQGRGVSSYQKPQYWLV